MNRTPITRSLRGTALALLAAASLSACAPLLVGTAVGGAFVAADRRTSGALLEDQSIELKAANRIRDTIGNQAHVNVTSYNRHVLLTGEVQDDHARESAARAASQVENVVNVMNELVVAPNSSLSARSNDVLIQGKVKATLIDARDLMANAFKVVVERGEVYLMGVVTEREANRAAELTATISGVRKVVKAFQVISEDELARRLPSPATNPNTGSNAGSAQPQ
ncbi:transporter [Aquabacterium olei]|uniref:Transporter n=1 Tax=Aquabacterium olei TaxID=1296669 RepID=A0A2U8FU93_9BURK|nr:BON domain-containing protein [Aquabacterium olei]AWI54625.1 transporter [Aquabacterium olei]